MNLPPLIPRKVFFGNPDKSSVQLSPDGSQLAYLAPREGVLNVWAAPRGEIGAARPMTHDTHRGIHIYFWACTNRHILYLRDANGDENWHVRCVDLQTGLDTDLTPLEGVQAQVSAVSHKFPGEIVVGLNNRDPQWHDLYRIDIVTGARTLLMQNDRFVSVMLDDDYLPRLAWEPSEGGGLEVFIRCGEDWRPSESVPPEDSITFGPQQIDEAGQVLFLLDSRGRNTAALFAQELATGKKTLLAEDSRADVHEIVFHPLRKHPQAVGIVYERKEWRVLDEAIEPDLAYLGKVCDGELEIASRTLDDRYWIVYYVVDDGPVRFYLYDRPGRRAEFLFTNRKELEGLTLAKMRPAVIKSRDGLDLVAYYTLPPGSDSNGDGIPDRPLPTVFTPHGGPWAREMWGFNSFHQWMANRGYAVLCVNFRSSTGFGKAFINAGDREWGGKIHQDQIDAVQWAIREGIADADKVAVYGGSFGGYSVLAGLTFSPEVFACGVDLVGPSNLTTFMDTIPPYWKPMLEMLIARVGDPRTAEGQAMLREQSPLFFVDRICRPLLIGQGANDPRVKREESDQIARAMQAKNIPVTYLLYPDEGHGFARPENNLSFNAIAEGFLAKCLGGRAEPLADELKSSSAQVLAGAQEVPGLNPA